MAINSWIRIFGLHAHPTYFLWGHLKQFVYNPLPKKIYDLKANLEREIKKISKNNLNLTCLNFEKSCESIISADDGHIEIKKNHYTINKILFSSSLKKISTVSKRC